MWKVFSIVLLVVFVFGCATVPASYAPTTGRVGSSSGKACMWKILGIIPTGDEEGLLARAADAAGNPTKDVAVFYYQAFYYVVTHHCVTVKGNR